MTWIYNKDRKTEKQALTGLSHDMDLHHRQENSQKGMNMTVTCHGSAS